MQILLLTHYFEPENGAPQRRWSALIERLVLAGHSVHVLAPPPHYPSGRVDPSVPSIHRRGRSALGPHGALVHRVGYLAHQSDIVSRTLDHLWTAAASVRRARQLAMQGAISPDVVVATAPGMPTLIAGHLVARALRKPLIAEMRDAWPDLVSHVPGMLSGSGVIASIKRRMHSVITDLQKRAAVVVTTTESFAEILRARGMQRVHVIRNGTSLERYANVAANRDDHPEVRVLYMGTVGRSQGLETLVRAAALARNAGVNLDVRIVGYGADVKRLRTLNRELGCPVKVLGGVSASEVLGHYTWADTAVVALRDWRPFEWTVPSKLYELMATGKHITGILAGEARDLMIEADIGDVVPPGDPASLASLFASLAKDRSRLAGNENGRRWVAENVDFDVLAERYLDIMQIAIRSAAAQ